MQLPKSAEVFASLAGFDEIDSTNLELARQLASNAEHLSAVIAASQTMGQGRLGRSWQSPAGASLSLSVYLKGPFSEPGWVSLLAALAVTRALANLGVVGAGIKWPNDVLVQGKKISGILSQLAPSGGVIVGIGVNLENPADGLNATSLKESGVVSDIDSVAAAIGKELKTLTDEFETNPADVKRLFAAACITLGQQVRAELPGGDVRHGVASEVDESGQLVILTPEPLRLSAADVWHLRS